MEKVTLDTLLTRDITNKVICFPTDTVYGVGAKVDDLSAIQRIFEMKKRDGNKPMAILTPTRAIEKYVKDISDEAKTMMNQEWPGALTLIFMKTNLISDELTKGFPTVAFRMPASHIALRILTHFGLMAVTSINISGEKELNTIDEIEAQFKDYIDYLVIDPETLSKIPSKIVNVTSKTPVIIRR